jgi:hypothetical protein
MVDRHQSGRLTLIKTTLAAMPVYSAISLELPPWLLKAFDKIMKGFLWTCTDEVQGGKCFLPVCTVGTFGSKCSPNEAGNSLCPE